MKKFYMKFFTKFKNNRCEAEVLPFTPKFVGGTAEHVGLPQ